jgi:hypothetical protein
LTIGDVLVGQVERHPVGQVRPHGSEPFQRIEDFGFPFPQLTDGDRGRGLLSDELFRVRTMNGEASLSPLVSFGPEIDGGSDDFAVSFLGGDGWHENWARFLRQVVNRVRANLGANLSLIFGGIW